MMQKNNNLKIEFERTNNNNNNNNNSKTRREVSDVSVQLITFAKRNNTVSAYSLFY